MHNNIKWTTPTSLYRLWVTLSIYISMEITNKSLSQNFSLETARYTLLA